MLTMTEQLSPCGALISFLAIIEFARHRLSHESAKTVNQINILETLLLIKGKIGKTFENPWLLSVNCKILTNDFNCM